MSVVEGENAAVEQTSPAGGSTAPSDAVLQIMLDRLMAALVNGPSLNCRPHNSRQRVDLTSLKKLDDLPAEQALGELLGQSRKTIARARIPQPKRPINESRERPVTLDTAQNREGHAATPPAHESDAERAWSEQNTLVGKFHTIAEDARTYEQDTGVQVLNVGFPLLSLPPGSFAGGKGAGPAVRRSPGADRIHSSHIDCQASRHPIHRADLPRRRRRSRDAKPRLAVVDRAANGQVRCFRGEWPYPVKRRCAGRCSPACGRLCRRSRAKIPGARSRNWCVSFVPPWICRCRIFSERGKSVRRRCRPRRCWTSRQRPRPDEESEGGPTIHCSAVVGLFPVANQGLLRDMQAMAGGEKLSGQVQRFLSVAVDGTASAPVVAQTRPSQAGFRRRVSGC